ncbi:MAG: hypothetical protein P8Y97_07455 [Candidatus Lokiarchaeota archaeon]
MCGIFGIITCVENGNIGKIAFEGIKRLEYRGYDSCGIVSVSNNKLYVKKDSGKIHEIHQKFKLDDFPGNIALSHTRWATHGAPTKINSHPHLDCKEKIAVVHNGIIENFIPLKKKLMAKGHIFRSETDTEVIPHLIEEYMDNEGLSFKQAVIKAIKECKGAYGMAVCHAKYPNKLIVARKESPLIVGLEDGKAAYCASDIPAILPHTKRCYILEDDELAVLKPGSAEFFNIKNTVKKIDKEPKEINWSVGAAEKGGYEHFMLKEIYEEPNSIRRTLKIQKDDLQIFAKELVDAEHIYITAAGTSYYASLAGKFILSIQ